MTALPAVQAAIQLALDTASPDVRPSAECLARVAIEAMERHLAKNGMVLPTRAASGMSAADFIALKAD